MSFPSPGTATGRPEMTVLDESTRNDG